MLRLLLTIALLAACDEDDGPNSPECIEVRMQWLELDYHRRQLIAAGSPSAGGTALAQDKIVSANMRCFPGFTLTTQ